MQTRKNKEFSDVRILSEGRPISLFFSQLFSELEDEAKRGREILADLAVFAICALFCTTHIVFGAFPLGIAFLCAARRRLAPCILGLLFGCAFLSDVGAIYALVYIAIFCFRIFASAPVEKRRVFPICEHYFEEAVSLRIALSVFFSFLLSLYQILLGGIDKASLFFVSATLLLTPVFCLLFMGMTESNLGVDELFGLGKRKRNVWGRVSPFYAQISLLSYISLLVFSLNKISMFGVSFGLAFLTLSTFFVSKRFGALRGCLTGLVASLSLSIVYAPSFALLGLVSGILWQLGSFYALILGAASAIGWASYIGGLGGFIYLSPALSAATLLFFPLFSKIRSEGEREQAEMKERKIKEQTESAVSTDYGADRIKRLSRSFSELSETFSKMSRSVGAPTREDYFSVCKSACADFCPSCARCNKCWEEGDKEAYFAFSELSSVLERKGDFRHLRVSDSLFSKCPNMKKILYSVSDSLAEENRKRHRSNKNDLIAIDYAMISRLLESISDAEKSEGEQDVALCDALAKACDEKKLSVDRIAAYGKRRKRIALSSRNIEGLRKALPELHGKFEKIVGCALSPFELERTSEALTARTYAIRSFDVEFASATLASGTGEISGDRQKCFFSRDEYFYSVISDGMGSGEEAAESAEISVTFLEQMLKVGVSKTLSLKMLNNLLRLRENECSATVDLFEFDLLYGRTTFIKSGAALSYVKRGEDVFRIRSRTAPLGIMKKLDAEKTDFEIADGDVIIMLSDGVSGEGDDNGWLLALLSKERDDSLDSLAKEILAVREKDKENDDDMTVAVIRVTKNNEVTSNGEGRQKRGKVVDFCARKAKNETKMKGAESSGRTFT